MSSTDVKVGGGTRNYAKAPSTIASRKAEYERLMASGKYDPRRSFYDPSGGFVVTHKDHNLPNRKDQEKYATTAILVQGNSQMSKEYVQSQVQKFKENSPKRARDKLNYVIVVGQSGNVHRHKLK